MKKVLIATVAVFVAWNVIDYIIHVVLLGSTYATLPQLFRPMEEMKMGLMYFVSLVSAFVFTWIYSKFISPKSMMIGLQFGLILGVSYGIGMGYGTYSVQPIPYNMALTWFLGTIVCMGIGGLITGLIVKE
jgi:hypothetical protein